MGRGTAHTDLNVIRSYLTRHYLFIYLSLCKSQSMSVTDCKKASQFPFGAGGEVGVAKCILELEG